MNPKKTNELVKPVALKNDVSEELVQDLMSFFWLETRKALTDLKSNYVHVENLGTFKVKHWKIQEVKSKYEKMLEKYTNNNVTFQRFALIKEINKRLETLYNLEKIVEADEQKKQSIKNKRNENQ